MDFNAEEIAIEINYLDSDLRVRNKNRERLKISFELQVVYDVTATFNRGSFPLITWLKRQQVELRNILSKLEAVAIDSWDAGLYNTAESLLKKLELMTALYSQSYLDFEALVLKSNYLYHAYHETPAKTLVKLAENSCSLEEALEAFRRYLNRFGVRGDSGVSLEEITMELEMIEVLKDFH